MALEDNVIVKFKADLTGIRDGLRELAAEAKATKASMAGKGPGAKVAGKKPTGGADKDPENMKQRIGWAKWYHRQTLQADRERVGWAKTNIDKIRHWESTAYKMTLAEQRRGHSEALKMVAGKEAADKKATKARMSRVRSEGEAIEKAHGQALKEKGERGIFGPKGALATAYHKFYSVVSAVRAGVYVFRLAADVFRFFGNVVMGVVNAFVALLKLWKNVVVTALKMGAAVGVAVAGALAVATKQAIDFESAMLRVGGVLTKRLDQMPQLEKAIRNVAKAFGMSADEAAAAAFQLASYGYTQAQTAEMIPGVTVLARAAASETGGAPDPEKAAEAVGRILLVWRKSGREATNVANVLAAANAKTAATFERLYSSMPKAAQAANLVKMSFEETVATLSQFYNAGLSAEQAGAALLGLIVRLIAPTVEFRKTIEAHNVAYENVNPAIVGFRRAIQNLISLGLNPMEIATFRNRNGLIALNVLVQQGAAEHDRLTQAVTGTRQAEEQSAIQLSGVAAKWQVFKTTVRDLAITLTEKLRPVVSWFLDKLTKWVDWFAQTPQVRALANAIANLAGRFATLAVNLLATLDLRKMWPKFVAATTGYLATAAKVVTVGMGVIEYAVLSIADKNSPLRKLWSDFWEFIVKSVVWASQIVVGVMAGMNSLLEHSFEKSNVLAERWGSRFAAMTVELARIVTAELMKIAAEAMLAMNESLGMFAGALGAVSLFVPTLRPTAIALAATVVAAEVGGRRLRKSAEELEEKSPDEVIASLRGRFAGYTKRFAPELGEAGEPLTEAWSAGKKAAQAQGQFARDLMSGRGVAGMPWTSAVGQTLNRGIDEWNRTLSNLSASGDKAAQATLEAGEKIGKLPLVDTMGDFEDGVEGATEQVEKFGDKLDGLATKVIGAPLEMIQKYISPAGMAQATRTPIQALLGLFSRGKGPMAEAADKQVQAADMQVEAARMQMGIGGGGGGGTGVGDWLGGLRSQGADLVQSLGRVVNPQGYYRAPTYRTTPGREGHWRTRRIDESVGGESEWERKSREKARADYERVSRERELVATLVAGGNTPKERAAAQAKIAAEFAADRAKKYHHFGREPAGARPWTRTRYEPEWVQGTPERTEMIHPGGWVKPGPGGAFAGGGASVLASLMASPGKHGQRLRQSLSARGITDPMAGAEGRRDQGDLWFLGPLMQAMGGGRGGMAAMVGAAQGPAPQRVDVYVHFDPNTLKPGVSKVVQDGIRQAIPALTGVR